jgi:hypothetical protein
MRRAVQAGDGIVVVSGMCVAALYAQQPATSSTSTPIDVSKLGSQVGERVPDFSLPDQNGKVWTLRSIMGPRGDAGVLPIGRLVSLLQDAAR